MALKARLPHYQAQLIYVCVALTVMLPLLRPGFVLTLDMVFTPHIRMPNSVTSSYLFYAFLHCLNYLVPSSVLEKIVLCSILFLAGFGMYRLIGVVRQGQNTVFGSDEMSRYIGGVLYMVNPFTYARFMAGQFAVLLGYCLLPFFVHSLLGLLQRPSWKNGAWVAVWIILIGIVSIHTLGSVGVLFALGLGFALWRVRKDARRSLTLLKFSAMSIGATLIASSYWLVPLALGHGVTAQAIAGFGSGDEQAFATLGGSVVGKVANIIRLQGFWAEGHDLFTLPQSHMVGWGLVVLVLWLLVGVGAVSAWRRRERFITAVLLASMLTGIVLATGVVTSLLARAVPLFGGYREPDKFVALVAFTYAFFAAEGVRCVLNRYEHGKRQVKYVSALCAFLLLPVALTPTMFWGFGAQLQPRQYPATWYDMNTRLNRDSSDFQVLFLPWHLYMYYDFAGRIMASPAPDFFDKPTLASNLPEIGHASPTDNNPQKAELDDILPSAAHGTQLGSRLAPLGVKYVLLDKDDDYRSYGYLDSQTDLRLVSQDSSFKLYINTAYRGEK